VDLRPLRGQRLAEERLSGRAQLLLQITHGLIDDPATDLAILAQGGRDAPVGRFRSGWRTADLRAWLAPGRGTGPRDLPAAQRAIEEGTVVLPLGTLGWSWIELTDADLPAFHPHFGPDFSSTLPGKPPAR
jgi:hypothetical protein